METSYKHLPVVRLANAHAQLRMDQLAAAPSKQELGEVDSAVACAVQANNCVLNGAIWTAEQRALKSLAYSCGGHSTAYAMAAAALEFKYRPRTEGAPLRTKCYDFDLTQEDEQIRMRMMCGKQSRRWLMYVDAYCGDYDIMLGLRERGDEEGAVLENVHCYAQEADRWYERDYSHEEA
jgi:hypothetical protein